jgi:hypothetical protein
LLEDSWCWLPPELRSRSQCGRLSEHPKLIAVCEIGVLVRGADFGRMTGYLFSSNPRQELFAQCAALHDELLFAPIVLSTCDVCSDDAV